MNFPQYPMMNPIQQAVVQGVQSYFNRGTHGPTEYGQVPQSYGNYGEGQQHGGAQNSWTPLHVAPQHYQAPYSGMGFNPNQSVGQHQYGVPQHQGGQESQHREEVKRYMRDICEGREQMPPELMQMMCYAAAQAVQEYMGNEQNGSRMPYSAGGSSEESHKKFKKTIEKIRKLPNYQEKMRMIAECFPKVQQGTPAYKVLVDLVTKVPSIEQRAGGLQMKPEQYEELKQELKHMQE